jgi:type II secretory pathway component PulC
MSRAHNRWLPALALTLVAGCASAQEPNPESVAPGPEPGQAGAATPDTAAPAPAPAPTSSAPGTIRRATLEAYLSRGAQSFISQVRTRPAFIRGRFYGWRIVSYAGPGPIHEGDVIHRVNGQSIERPEQFMQVWNGLSGSQRLTVKLFRKGRPLLLSYDIID